MKQKQTICGKKIGGKLALGGISLLIALVVMLGIVPFAASAAGETPDLTCGIEGCEIADCDGSAHETDDLACEVEGCEIADCDGSAHEAADIVCEVEGCEIADCDGSTHEAADIVCEVEGCEIADCDGSTHEAADLVCEVEGCEIADCDGSAHKTDTLTCEVEGCEIADCDGSAHEPQEPEDTPAEDVVFENTLYFWREDLPQENGEAGWAVWQEISVENGEGITPPTFEVDEGLALLGWTLEAPAPSDADETTDAELFDFEAITAETATEYNLYPVVGKSPMMRAMLAAQAPVSNFAQLQAAVAAANASEDSEPYVIPVTNNITFTVGATLDITHSITFVNTSGSAVSFFSGNARQFNISGEGVDVDFGGITLDGNNFRGGIYVPSGNVSVANVTVQRVVYSGYTTSVDGGGILLQSGTLTLKNFVRVAYNTMSGIYSKGTLIIEGDTTANNNNGSNDGGGIYSTGTLIVNGTLSLTDNQATSSGGGLYNENGTLIVNGTLTASNNRATNSGGGIMCKDASMLVTGSGQMLVQSNRAHSGSGIYSYISNGAPASNFTVEENAQLTVSYNRNTGTLNNYGGGIYSRGVNINFKDSAKVTMDYNTCTSGSRGMGGGVYNGGVLAVSDNAELIMDNNSNYGSYGGAIYNPGVFSINGNAKVTIKNSRSSMGHMSGALMNDGTLTLNNNAVLTVTDSNCSGVANRGTLTTNDNTQILVSGTVQNHDGILNWETLVMNGNSIIDTSNNLGVGIENNHDSSTMMPGTITVNKGATLLAENNRREGICNRSRTAGYIISTITVNDGGTIISRGNTDSSVIGGSGGVYNSVGSEIIINNGGVMEVSDNKVTGSNGIGAGISNSGKVVVNDGGSLTVQDNTLNVISVGTGYAVNSGAGIYNGYPFNTNKATFTVENGGLLTVSGNVIEGDLAGHGGSGIFNHSQFTIAGTANITNNGTTNRSGGGIYNYTDAVFTVASGGVLSVSENTASSGGGIYNYTNGIFDVEDGGLLNVSGNTAGGGITNNNGKFTVKENGILQVNNNTGNGILNQGRLGIDFTIAGTATVTKNVSGNAQSSSGSGSTGRDNGGGIYSSAPFVVTDTGVLTVSGNTSFGGAGGIYVFLDPNGALLGSTFTVDGTLNVADNSLGKDEKGGGIYIGPLSSLLVTGTANITGNSAQYGGGIYNSSGGNIEVSATGALNVQDNTAANDGGGIYNDRLSASYGDTLISVDGTTNITGNTAGGNGGGIYNAADGTMTLSGVANITDNTAPIGDGGGIYTADYTALTVSSPQSVFANNVSRQGYAIAEADKATHDTYIKAKSFSAAYQYGYNNDDINYIAPGREAYKLYYDRGDNGATPVKLAGMHAAGDTVAVAGIGNVGGDDWNRANLVFTAWHNTGAAAGSSFVMPAADVTLVAQWVNGDAPYVVHHYLVGTTTSVAPSTSGSGQIGQTIVANAVSLAGYTADAATKDITLVAVTGGAVNELVFEYTPKTYRVRFFDYNNTQLGTTQIVPYGGDAVAPLVPAREGYAFTGWDKSYQNITQDTDVYALYTPLDNGGGDEDPDPETASYVVHHYLAGTTSSVAPSTFGSGQVGQTVVARAVTLTRYTADAATKSLTLQATGNVIVFEYTPQTYRVRFFDHDGTQLGVTQTVAYGGDAVAPRLPTRDGHTFIGWDKSYLNITRDTDVYALYQPLEGNGSSTSGGTSTTSVSGGSSTGGNGSSVDDQSQPSQPSLGFLQSILAGQVPLINLSGGAWSLLSLLLSVLALIMGVVLLVRSLGREKPSQKQEEDDNMPELAQPDEEEEEKKDPRRLTVVRVVAMLLALLPGFVFLILDNMRLPMTWINRYTLWVAIAFILFAVVTFIQARYNRHRADKDNEDEDWKDGTTNSPA